MIDVVMDTSSLISLEIIGILKESLEIVKIIIPSEVKNELEEIAKYTDKEGKAAKNALGMIKNKRVDVVEIKNPKKVDNLLSKDISHGEAEAFVCCIEQNIKTLIMDDVDAASGLEGVSIANNIKIKLSVAVLVELYRQSLMDKQKLTESIRRLIKIRGWEGGALEVLADRYLENI